MCRRTPAPITGNLYKESSFLLNVSHRLSEDGAALVQANIHLLSHSSTQKNFDSYIMESQSFSTLLRRGVQINNRCTLRYRNPCICSEAVAFCWDDPQQPHLLTSDPLGHTFLYSAFVEQPAGFDLQLSLSTTSITSTPSAKNVAVTGNRLSYEIHMAAVSQPMQLHLSGQLERVTEPVAVPWLKERLTDCIIIDVREPNEYAEGYIPGAHSFPLGLVARDIDNPHSPLRVLYTRRSGAPFILYCKSGYRSQLAQDEFVLAGLEGTVSLEGGYRAWFEQAEIKI